MAKTHLEKTFVALAGEFLVARQLSLRGYAASLTLKNYPKVDIFCMDPQCGLHRAIQVKTKRGGRAYYIPENIDEENHPFVFVYIRPDNDVDYYIVPAEDVAQLSLKERDEYLLKNPHVNREQPRMLSIKSIRDYKDRWELIWSAAPDEV